EALADRAKHGHLPVGPLDPADALGRESQVLDVESLRYGHRSLSSVVRRRVAARACAAPTPALRSRCPPARCRWPSRGPPRAAAALRTRRRIARSGSAEAA